MPARKARPSLIPPNWPLDVQPTDESGEVDLSLIEHNLSLTPAERLRQNDRFADFIQVVRLAGRKLRDGKHLGSH